MGPFIGAHISCTFVILVPFTEINKILFLSPTSFPLVGFSKAIGQKFMSTVCCLKMHVFIFGHEKLSTTVFI